MIRSIAACSCCIPFVVSTFGCDPVRTTQQTCVVQVKDLLSKNPVPGAQIQMKYDFDRGEVAPQVSAPQFQEARKFWEGLPWFSGVTDANGRAEIRIEQTALDGTSGRNPPPNRDLVTARPYLFKIYVGQAVADEFSVLMNPNEYASGNACVVTVIRIDRPIYITTNSGP